MDDTFGFVIGKFIRLNGNALCGNPLNEDVLV